MVYTVYSIFKDEILLWNEKIEFPCCIDRRSGLEFESEAWPRCIFPVLSLHRWMTVQTDLPSRIFRSTCLKKVPILPW